MRRFLVLAICLWGIHVDVGAEEPVHVTPASHPVDLTPRPRLRVDLPADGFNFVSGVNSSLKQYRAGNGTNDATTTTTSTTMPSSKTSHYGACMLKYIPATCKPSEYCGTKKMCVQVSGDPCCAPADGECPSATQLDIRCVKGDPINWCNHHTDCARGAICCDTGCGYNICVEQFSAGPAANAAAAAAASLPAMPKN